MDEKQALEIYRIWLDEQERFEPFIPIRYMADKTGLGHGTLQEAVKILVRLNKAEPVANGERGMRRRYRMLK